MTDVGSLALANNTHQIAPPCEKPPKVESGDWGDGYLLGGFWPGLGGRPFDHHRLGCHLGRPPGPPL
eukprot:8068871-Pyramimonas_sp.AAC.1